MYTVLFHLWWKNIPSFRHRLSESLPHVEVAGIEPGIAVDMGQAWSGMLEGMGDYGIGSWVVRRLIKGYIHASGLNTSLMLPGSVPYHARA